MGALDTPVPFAKALEALHSPKGRLLPALAWHEQGGELCRQGLDHLQTSEVGALLEELLRV